MKWLSFLCLLIGSHAQERRFPEDFMFGAATSAYQIEGGWSADDKGENIWDRLTHTKPNVIKDVSNGDVAADTYNNYKRDVEMMRELGLDAYRFSLSWSRILPNGLANKVSDAGVEFYNNYIDEMIKYGIKPMVTLYHWDLPQKLQDLGGFLNPLFPEWFEDYVRVVFEKFGDRVKHWITFNEPKEFCHQGYGSATKAPLLNITDIGTYYCARTLLLAHARAYRVYKNEFKKSQGGACGIAISVGWYLPLTDSEEDKFAAEIKRQADFDLYIKPIYSKEGGFPKEIVKIVAEKSANQGYLRSRLPNFTEEEKELIRGTGDFIGVNHYTSSFVSATEYKIIHPVPSLYDDIDVGSYAPPEWPKSASAWLVQTPNSLYDALINLHKRYNGPIFYITENGWSSPPGADILDDDRIRYYRAALNDALKAIEDGVDLRGFMAWSLMDNFEWFEGYGARFGLYRVNFSSPGRERTPRKSAFVYKQIIKSRMIDEEYEPDTLDMSIDEGNRSFYTD